jgi:hypothetical protein
MNGLQSRSIIGSAILLVMFDTAAVFGALGWLYVAVIGIARPNDLPLRIVSSVPVRRDTAGIVFFGLSAAAYFFGGALKPAEQAEMSDSALPVGGEQRATPAGGRSRTIATAFLRTLFVYSTALAIYLMVQTVTNPGTLAVALTHLLTWPTERAALVLALICSVASFILLRTSTRMSNLHDKRGRP